MADLANVLQQIVTKWGYKLDELSPGVFRLDVGIRLKDGSVRYQYVFIWIEKPQNGGREKYYMNSRCGRYSPSLNHYDLLKDENFFNYCTLTITNDKTADGTPCETLIVQSAPYVESTSVDLLSEIIFEVANNADYIESKYFGGGDSN